MISYLPIVKLEPGKYLIGTHAKQLQLKGICVLVRSAGGFMQLDDYLKHYARVECLELNTLMRKGDGTIKTSVLNLLNKYKTGKDDSKAIRRYHRLHEPEMDQEFERLMEEVKQLEQQMSPLYALAQ